MIKVIFDIIDQTNNIELLIIALYMISLKPPTLESFLFLIA